MTVATLARRAAGWAAVAARALLGPQSGPACGILVYHRVVERVPGLPAPTLNVRPEALAAQIAGLQRRGWTFVSLADLVADRGRAPNRVAVTFDDVFGSVESHALPILRAAGVPAAAFVASAFVGSDEPFPFDCWGHAHRDALDPDAYRPATLEQIHALHADPLVTLGAHTHTHEVFVSRPRDLADDLAVNLAWLDRTLGVRRPPLAFPFGRTAMGFAGGDLTEAALSLGVSATFTTDGDPLTPGTPPIDWPRITVYDDDTDATLDAKLSGRFAWTMRASEHLRHLVGWR